MSVTNNIANIELHKKEAKCFNELHPELFSKEENRVIITAMNKINDCVEEKSNIAVVELACGTGRLSKKFLNAGFRVTSCDLSSDMLEVFKTTLSEEERERVQVENVGVEVFLQDKDKNKKYDLIILGAFLHHVVDVKSFLKSLLPHLNTNGMIFIVHDPALRDKRCKIGHFIIEKIDSLIFQFKYLFFKGKLIPRSKFYGNADIHTKCGIDDLELLEMFKVNNVDILYYERYFTHKTHLITFIDKYITKLLPQFVMLVRNNKTQNIEDMLNN